MQDNEELNELIAGSEFLMEGLDKGFWRLIKLIEPEIWTNIPGSTSEYAWVVAIMGNYCISYDDVTNHFFIASYSLHGELSTKLQYQHELHYLIPQILNSRYVIN
ncbi:hypothetical protein C2869_02410 [Saccharobesus litoralis]|uniref:Uncharacterized protein n=1 Tax=Saccharobesus litoralis TaxID=2172099 RepID=A0A2S0VMB2_9ALTE|nr:hypothetical protein [Saccharobesus litoralis]AWB65361.1 hypothetical protein C2869_02410 [Saccharobesus litoralis]